MRTVLAWSSSLALLALVAIFASTAAPSRAAEDRLPVARAGLRDLFGGDEPDDYALDARQRYVEPGRLACDQAAMVRYKSRALRYTVTVHPAFAARLARFDQVLVDLATAHYGRAPRRLLHRGARP